MTKFSEIAKDPHYDSAASGASRATIFVFIATFVYLLLFADASPGVLGGAAFFCIGIFAVSLVISMPLFLIRAKLPRFGSLVSIADIAATFFVTRAVYLCLFSVPIPSVGAASGGSCKAKDPFNRSPSMRVQIGMETPAPKKWVPRLFFREGGLLCVHYFA